MAICTDRATQYLKGLGYSVVRHPREGISPLDLIGVQNGVTHYLGRIDQLVQEPAEHLPAIRRNEVASNINGQASSKLSPAIGINVLSSVLNALGGNLGVTTQYEGARSIQFVFEDVRNDSVVPLELGGFLRNGNVDGQNIVLHQYVMGNGDLFVITRTVKSNRFTVRAEAIGGGELMLDVPAIRGLVSGNLKVSASAERSGTVTYEGSRWIVFGFECFAVGVEDGVLSIVSSRPGLAAFGARGERDPSTAVILSPEGLVDLPELGA